MWETKTKVVDVLIVEEKSAREFGKCPFFQDKKCDGRSCMAWMPTDEEHGYCLRIFNTHCGM